MKRLATYLLSLCLFTTATCKQITSQGASVPYFRLGYKYNGEVNGWFKLHRVPATWNDAHSRCIKEGAQLASPINDKFLRIMKDTMNVDNIYCGLFTGIHDTLNPGSFSSIEGVPLELIPMQWKKSTVCPEKFGKWIILRADGTLDSGDAKEEYPFLCYKKNKDGKRMGSQGYIKDDRTGSSYKFHRHAKIWSEAKTVCEQEDAHLVIINSATEALVLQDLFREYCDEDIIDSADPNIAFVGMSRWEEAKQWLTLYGQTLDEAGYSFWGPKSPNGQESVDPSCGAICRSAMFQGKLCSLKHPFICEQTPFTYDE